jgi:HAD superfamily hydrolase (TIGR01509 family)
MAIEFVIPAGIRACVFDFDGVLVDSEPLHMHAISEAVAERGWAVPEDQFVAEIVGRGDERAFHTIAGWYGARLSGEETAEFLRVKRRAMLDGIAGDRFRVQPGAREAVEASALRFAKTGGIGVCSGSIRETVLAMLGRAGLSEPMRFVVCGDDVPRMKPAPDGYLKAVASLGVDPRHAVAIEDTTSGVQAAKAAGLLTVAVMHTMGAEQLSDADVVVPWISNVKC